MSIICSYCSNCKGATTCSSDMSGGLPANIVWCVCSKMTKPTNKKIEKHMADFPFPPFQFPAPKSKRGGKDIVNKYRCKGCKVLPGELHKDDCPVYLRRMFEPWEDRLWKVVQKIHKDKRAIYPMMTIFFRSELKGLEKEISEMKKSVEHNTGIKGWYGRTMRNEGHNEAIYDVLSLIRRKL